MMILGLLAILPFGLLFAAENNPSWEILTQVKNQHPYNLAGFLNDTYGITVGYAGECHYTKDGGKTWPKAENTSYCRFGLEILDENNAWHSGNAAQIGVSNDGGKSWRLVQNFGGGEPEHCRYISFINSTTGWMASLTKLGVTVDGGKSWTSVKLPKNTTQISAIAAVSQDAVYLLDTGSNGGTLYFTDNGGQKWSTFTLGGKWDFYPVSRTPVPAAMRFFDKDHGIIIANCKGGQLWELDTNNGGKDWTKAAISGPKPTGSLFLSPDGKFLTVNGVDETITVLHKKN